MSVSNFVCNTVYYPCHDLMTRNHPQYVQNVCSHFILVINDMKWYRLQNMVKLHFCAVFNKLICSSTPFYIKEKLVSLNVIHNCTTRHHNHHQILIHCQKKFHLFGCA